MGIALKNGRFIILNDADRYQIVDGYLFVKGKRDHLIATFTLESVAGWWYDNENVTTYGVTDQLEST